MIAVSRQHWCNQDFFLDQDQDQDLNFKTKTKTKNKTFCDVY